MKFKMKDTALHRMALLHMIGQLEDMGKDWITTGEIASLMGVTKPTAIKRLNMLAEYGSLIKATRMHRPNCDAFVWQLGKGKRRMYRNGLLSASYHIWRNEAFGEKGEKS